MMILDAGRRLFTALTAITLLLPGQVLPLRPEEPAVCAKAGCKSAAKPAAVKALAVKPAPSAQSTATAPVASTAPRPWFYEHSDVPMDMAWQFGVLPNGLRYAVRRNDIPAHMVSIRVRIRTSDH